MPRSNKTGKRKKQGQGSKSQAPSPASPVYSNSQMSPRARLISLIVGDILCFLIFVSFGSSQHGEGFNFLYSLWLAVPFVVAWFLVAPLVGAYKSEIATQPKKMFIRIALAWLATWPVAMFLRWLLVDRVKTPPVTVNSFISFAIVTLCFNLVLLLLWRVPFAMNNGLRKRNIARTP